MKLLINHDVDRGKLIKLASQPHALVHCALEVSILSITFFHAFPILS